MFYIKKRWIRNLAYPSFVNICLCVLRRKGTVPPVEPITCNPSQGVPRYAVYTFYNIMQLTTDDIF